MRRAGTRSRWWCGSGRWRPGGQQGERVSEDLGVAGLEPVGSDGIEVRVPGCEGSLGDGVRFEEQGDHGSGPGGERRGLPDSFQVSDQMGAALGVGGSAHPVVGGEPVMDDRARIVGRTPMSSRTAYTC